MPAGAAAYNILLKKYHRNDCEISRRARRIRRLPARARLTPAFPPILRVAPSAQARSRSPRRTLYVFDESAKAIALRVAEADGRVKDLLGYLNHAVEQRAAASQDDAARKLRLPTRLCESRRRRAIKTSSARGCNISHSICRESCRGGRPPTDGTSTISLALRLA